MWPVFILYTWLFVFLQQNATKALAIKNIHVYLYEPLFRKLGKCNKLFIPIIHKEEYHHTLLMLDRDVPRWVHFDSNRGRTRYKAGKCFNNAKVMVRIMYFSANIFNCFFPVLSLSSVYNIFNDFQCCLLSANSQKLYIPIFIWIGDDYEYNVSNHATSHVTYHWSCFIFTEHDLLS